MTKPIEQSDPVVYTSTKSDIWKAYQDLLKKLNSKDTAESANVPIEFHPAKEIASKNLDLRSLLNQQIINLSQLLSKESDSIIDQLQNAGNILQQLKEVSENDSQTFKAYKASRQEQQSRQEEEFNYEFDKKKKRLEEELAEKHKKADEDLRLRKQVIESQEKEFADLKQKSENFEKNLEQSIKLAVDKKAKELEEKFEHERILNSEKTKAKDELSSQKILSLEEIIKNQTEEIKLLQASIKDAHAQLTHIAERAVDRPVSHVYSASDSKKDF